MGIFENFKFDNLTILDESEDKSKLNKNFKKKELSNNLKIIDIRDKNINNYIEEYDCLRKRKNWINSVKKEKDGEIIIDIKKDKIIGSIFIKEKGNQRIMGGIYIDEDYRGQGLGELLFKDAVEKYKGNILGVYTDNQVAIMIYKKYGFEIFEEDLDENGEKFYKMTNSKKIKREG